MNIKEKILYCVFFYNRILIVVPLYVLSFTQIILIFHSHLFSFVSEEKKIYYFYCHLSIMIFYSRGNNEGNYLLSNLIMKY